MYGGWGKRVCGGDLRGEHKAPQDTEAVCMPQMLLPDGVCECVWVCFEGS